MKKTLAIILSIVMMTLPFVAQADATKTTVSFQHGSLSQLFSLFGLEGYADAFNDLIDVLGITTYTQDTQAGASITLDGESVLTAEIGKTGRNIVLASNLLGTDVVALSEDEIVYFCNKELAKYNLDLARVWAIINAYLSEMDFSDLTFEQTKAMASALVSRAEVSQVTEPLEGCDPATQMYTMTLTGDDIAAYYIALANDMLNCKFINKVVTDLLAISGEQMDTETLQKQFASTVQQTYGQMNDINLVVYTDENGLVAMQMLFGIEESIITAVMTRTTYEDFIQYQVVYDVMVEENEIAFAVVFVDAGENNGAFSYAISSDMVNNTVSYVWSGDQNDRALTTTVLFDAAGDGYSANAHFVTEDDVCNVDVVISAMGEKLLSVLTDPDLLTIHGSITTVDDYPTIIGNEIHPVSMSREELSNWVSSLSVKMMTVVFSAAQKLPASVLSLVFRMW